VTDTTKEYEMTHDEFIQSANNLRGKAEEASAEDVVPYAHAALLLTQAAANVANVPTDD
jgi:hypothetical protein